MKKSARGCGKTCECPRMKYNFEYLETAYNYINLVRDGFLTLDDVGDLDWNVMNQLLIAEVEEKEAKELHAQKVKEILG